MSEFENELYLTDLNKAIEYAVGIEDLTGCTVMVTGATGEIGGFLVDALMQMNENLAVRRSEEVKPADVTSGEGIYVIACGRDIEQLQHRFEHWKQSVVAERLVFAHYDMLDEINDDLDKAVEAAERESGLSKNSIDYIIHAAGNAYPSAFVNNPEETVKGNVIGTARLLDYAAKRGCKKFLYVSSGEVYSVDETSRQAIDHELSGLTGDKRNGIEPVAESLCEFVMQKVKENGPRSCYPLSKVAAELICMSEGLWDSAEERDCMPDDLSKAAGGQSGSAAGGKTGEIADAEAAATECIVARLCHTFGPGAKETDDRAHAQFARKAAAGERIVLNSAGSQLRSYNYIVDSASGILSVLLRGENGEAYDICSPGNTVTIRELAGLFAKAGGTKVIVNEPDEKQKALQSPISRQVLDSSKLESLGWTKAYELETATRNYVNILRGQSL